MKSAWYAISTPRNSEAEDGGVEVSIYDEIGFGGVTAKDFVADLRKLKGQHVHLRINSVGGSVVEGAAIYNALRRHKGGLTVHVDGLAASMASVIAMAGEEVLMADNAMMMVHNPWSMAMGDADDLRKEADVLDKLKATLVNAYVRKSGRERAEIENLMDEETWMDAVQAVDFGFADDIEEGIEAAASVTPEAARARFDNFSNSMARKSTKSIKAEEAAPAEVVAEPVVEQPVTDAAVDTSSEDNMNAELQAKVDALQAELSAKVEADTVRAQADEVTAKEIETLKSEVERLAAEVASKDEEISALRADQKSAGEQAAAIVASVGLEPVAVVSAEPELTAAQIFNNLSGAEAVEYYRTHKREIMASVY
jgi:ATP-dependent Clp endopeptidase proteolytic subunit ClpP